MLKRVLVESPFAPQDYEGRRLSIGFHLAYARLCVRNSVLRGEAPYPSHLLLTQPGILRDEVPEERAIGIACGDVFLPVCNTVAVYIDFGISSGMQHRISKVQSQRDLFLTGPELSYRNLPQDQIEYLKGHWPQLAKWIPDGEPMH